MERRGETIDAVFAERRREAFANRERFVGRGKDESAVPKLSSVAPASPHVSVHVIKNERDSNEGVGVSNVPGEFGAFGFGGAPAAPPAERLVGAEKNSDAKPVKFEAFAPMALPEFEPYETLPKIYLCSRTHSQLHQLVRELKRTPYRPKYTILGSRKQYCPMSKTDEECGDLIKNKGRGETLCGYYNKKDLVIDELVRAEIWDMEDLDKASKAHSGCQYFAMRALHKNAELILCPYNYVFDENIRKALEIDLNGNAVVIDEGHNVEDVCRDGASMEISFRDLEETCTQLEMLSRYFDDAAVAVQLVRPLKKWLAKCLENAEAKRKLGRSPFASASFGRGPVEPGIGETLWKGEEVARALTMALVPTARDGAVRGCPETETSAKLLARSVIQDAARVTAFDGKLSREINQNGNAFGLTAVATTRRICAGVSSALLFSEEYALCVTGDLGNPGATSGYSTRSRLEKEKNPGFALWCLRPAVSFRPVSDDARCVVVTSGTLSPMGSLEGELGVAFPIKVEAPHVVPSSQIHVEASDVLGDFTAKAQESEGTPNALGQLLLRYLRKHAIPGGVLVFLPKYGLIRKIIERWRDDGTLAEIETFKSVVWEEPGAQTLAPTLEKFRSSCKRGGRGCLFLAVFRGKVSEGLDFKDENARAVFCVGIPFPSMGDVKVRLKKEYNGTAHAKNEGMLSGGDWYQHQAFRAYNQALGRCVRHLYDYAAIFLVDGRFAQHADARRNKSMVSKWMRHLVAVFSSPRESVGVLHEFFQRLQRDPPGPPGRLPVAAPDPAEEEKGCGRAT
jgi:Fanconi anemia group J protein